MGKAFIQFSLKTTKKPETKKLREVWDLRWSARFETASPGLEGGSSCCPTAGSVASAARTPWRTATAPRGAR